MLSTIWKDNILLILHDFEKNKQRTESFAEKKKCSDTGGIPFTVNLGLGYIRFAISSVTFSAPDSVRDLVTRLRKLFLNLAELLKSLSKILPII